MSNAPAPSRSPLVLLVNAHEWSSRAFESILGPAGYAVLKAYSGREALAGAHRVRLDAVVLDTELPDVDAFTLCRALRVDPDITASTPIFLTTPGPTLRTELLEGLRAGANGLWGQPLDTEHFLLRLEGHLRAKLDADRAREHSLFDERTGLYTAAALQRRVRELAAQAERLGTALTCVALAPDGEPPARGDDGPGSDSRIESLGRMLRTAGRMSDTVGRAGPREFAVLAPQTSAAGAVGLGERLARAVGDLTRAAGEPPLRLRAGYETALGVRRGSAQPTEVVVRALAALRASEADPRGSWIRCFEG